MEKLPSYEEIMKNGKSVTNSNEGLPSYEEVMAANQQEPGTLHDLLIGGGQGVTLGFGDELLAALETGIKTATGKSKLEEMYDTYRNLQQQHEAEVEQAHIRSPRASAIGEIAGGLALPLGALGSVAKGAKLGERILSSATPGAVIGFLSSAGGSKANIDNLPEYASDIASGTLGGAVLSSALGGVGEIAKQGVKYGKEYIEESPKLLRALKAFELEKSGVNLTTESGGQEILSRTEKAANEAADALLGPLPEIKKAHASYIENNSKRLNKQEAYTLKDIFQSVPELKQEARRFNAKLINKKPLDTSDIMEVRRVLASNKNSIKEKYGDVYDSIFNKETGVMGYLNDIVNEHLPLDAKYRSIIKDSAKAAEDITGKKFVSKDYEGSKEKLSKKLSELMEIAGGTNRSALEARKTLNDLGIKLENMNTSLASAPKMPGGIDLSSKKVEVEPLIENIKDVSRQNAALTSTTGIKQTGDVSLKKAAEAFGDIGNLEAAGTQLAGKTGRFVNKAKWFDENVLPLSKVTEIPETVNQTAITLAEQLQKSTSPVMANLGKKLKFALENPSNGTSAAVINTIMQSSSARKELGLTAGKSLNMQNKKEGNG